MSPIARTAAAGLAVIAGWAVWVNAPVGGQAPPAGAQDPNPEPRKAGSGEAGSPAAGTNAPTVGASVSWQVARGVEVLCVLDAKGENLCIYRYSVATARLELVAARSIKFDLQLEELNAAAPTPAQVRERIKKDGKGAGEPGKGSSSVCVVPLKVSEDQQVLCVVDAGRGALCVYEFDVKQRKLRLAAARMLRYDFELQELNNDGLTPAEIEKQLKRSRENKKSAEGAGE